MNHQLMNMNQSSCLNNDQNVENDKGKLLLRAAICIGVSLSSFRNSKKSYSDGNWLIRFKKNSMPLK